MWVITYFLTRYIFKKNQISNQYWKSQQGNFDSELVKSRNRKTAIFTKRTMVNTQNQFARKKPTFGLEVEASLGRKRKEWTARYTKRGQKYTQTNYSLYF